MTLYNTCNNILELSGFGAVHNELIWFQGLEMEIDSRICGVFGRTFDAYPERCPWDG